MIAIIGALEEEVAILRSSIEEAKEIRKAGMPFWSGRLSGIQIVLAQTGIGKVNSTICTQILIDDFKASTIIFTGVAGALIPALSIGDIVVSSETLQHDFDLTVFGRKQGEIPRVSSATESDKSLIERFSDDFGKDIASAVRGIRFVEADNKLIDLACDAHDSLSEDKNDVPNLVVGKVVSGDRFVSGKEARYLQRSFGGTCTDMEGAAVGYTAHVNDVPFVVIRSISDRADGQGPDDFTQFLNKSAKISANLVLKMIELMEKKAI